MTASVGLLVVHGIGNQDAGSVGAPIAGALADPDSLRSVDGDPLTWKLSVENRPVIVHEANWAGISSPECAPETRLGWETVKETIKTLATALSSGIVLRGALPANSRAGGYISLGIALAFGLAFTNTLYQGQLVQAGTAVAGSLHSARPDQPPSDLGPVQIVDAVIFCAVLTALVVVVYRSPWLMALRKPVWVPVKVVVSVAGAILAFPPILIAAEFLFFVTAATLLALLAAVGCWLITWLVRKVGAWMPGPDTSIATRWLYRMTWTMLVLPTQTVQQFCKATSNLFSVGLLDPRLPRKVSATGWILVVIPYTLVIVVFCEILVIFALLPTLGFLSDGESSGAAPVPIGVAVAMVVFTLPVSFLVLKVALPGVDLLLDVSRYHLASHAERRNYHEFIRRGVKALVDAGCSEIHVLAHSLGSVLVYDWLRDGIDDTAAVTTLSTIGSPLNKFWYIDHTRRERERDASPLRDGSDLRWTNFWAWSDLVSGRLNRFGDAIDEHRLRFLGLLGLSHVAYWKRPEVLQSVKQHLILARGDGPVPDVVDGHAS